MGEGKEEEESGKAEEELGHFGRCCVNGRKRAVGGVHIFGSCSIWGRWGRWEVDYLSEGKERKAGNGLLGHVIGGRRLPVSLGSRGGIVIRLG